jgi:contractile injection system tape measure protein
VHPFLKTAFNRLNFLFDKKFADPVKHQKAIYLLHYLATGRKEAEEFELVVPKVLCGFPLEEPIETGVELTDAEIEEGDQVLDAVLAQWDILKNTSRAALREGFLQRGGKLSSKDDKLYLHVERNSIDILLNYLPWNLSLILLPWTNEILRVEWA